ncbi:AbrB/MazE/SpoVT family DNA-binding domain-containing protein [Candidatus Tisiphia endosymbiont of Parasteatoda lunata]|uniref:AbrB/MazE/SpoVT family DNA-binding domain-containing protein n=1 Tax=Candidatus Tisiphia endosymbiont of Parasteatoda lunata TaxID=3066275 RepID=UPI0039779ACA
MSARAILSSKGQLVIPKTLRTKLGLHSGSELLINIKNNDSLEIFSVKKNITSFFGMGKSKSQEKPMSIEDIDDAISKAIAENDRS